MTWLQWYQSGPKLTEGEVRISILSWDKCKEEVLKIIKENKEVSGIEKYGLNESSYQNMFKRNRGIMNFEEWIKNQELEQYEHIPNGIELVSKRTWEACKKEIIKILEENKELENISYSGKKTYKIYGAVIDKIKNLDRKQKMCETWPFSK